MIKLDKPGVKIGTLNSILATREKINFPHRINLDRYKNIEDMYTWCEENCKGVWRIRTSMAMYAQFTDQTDAMMFALRWGSG